MVEAQFEASPPNNSAMAITIRDRRKQAVLVASSFLCRANEIHLGSTAY